MLNSFNDESVISFRKISLQEARKFVEDAESVSSAVGHAPTAEVFSKLLGIRIETNRTEIKLGPETVLLIGSLGTRLPEGRILSKEELEALPIIWWVASLV